MSVNRRGTTLIELVVAVALTALLVSLAGSILARAAYTLRDRSERSALEQALRTASGAVRRAVEPLGRDPESGQDLLTATGAGLVLRALRGAGTLCAVAPGEVVIRVGPGWWSSLRVPVAGRDSLLIERLAEGSGWSAVALRAAPGATKCPDGSAALALPAGPAASLLPGIGPGSPLRVFEPLEFRVYASSSAEWIGVRAVATGEAIQPLAGPLGAMGTRLSYFRADGSMAGFPGEVATIRLELHAATEHPGGIGMARMPSIRADSIALLVGIRGIP